MDQIDGRILAELQLNGRLTLTELAARVGLSASPCHRRLRALEHAGVIAGYRALVDRTAVGLGFEALVFVTMSGADYGTLSDFDAAVISTASIIQAQRLFGSPDYLLRVVAKDLPDFQLIYDEQLSRLPGVQKLASTLVMKSLVEGRPLPL